MIEIGLQLECGIATNFTLLMGFIFIGGSENSIVIH